ncbi:MAG: DNA primase [Deltaproteobacteria bacterium]|nr:DNA primase [Deltaproteobacteria bacterium]
MAVFIPEDIIVDIKNTADIVSIISEVVMLKKAGKNYLGLCPFHSEKTPSFTVSPGKQIFHCFGCGIGGNVFTFIMKQNGISFPEAVKMLATRYGIEIPTQTMSLEQRKRIDERESLLAINRQAMDFFGQALHDSVSGEKAMAYLVKRGMTKEIIDRFHLGYSSEAWDKLANCFSNKKVSQGLVEKSGLVVKRKNKNGYYDRFRGRIIFPIFDTAAQVVGFGGRVLDDSLPKYLNSPETSLYNKSRSLYGLHIAKSKCRESELVYIVEGYFDLLALHQHGIQNSVATLGTSLTSEHVRILKGFIGKSGRIILVYDSDVAGIKAARRSIDVFDKEYVDAGIVVLPSGYDPDSYLFEFGSESFANTISKAKGVISFLIDSAVKKHGLSTEGKIHIVSDMKEPLAVIKDNVARSLYIKDISELVGIDESAILEKVKEVFKGKNARDMAAQKQHHVYSQDSYDLSALNMVNGSSLQTGGNRIERQVIAMMLQFPQILPEIGERNVFDLFENNTLKSIGLFILSHKDLLNRGVAEIISSIDDIEKSNIVASLAIGDDLWDRDGCFRLIAQFELSRKRHEKTLLREIKAAEKNNDYELLLQLLRKKQIQARSLSEKT